MNESYKIVFLGFGVMLLFSIISTHFIDVGMSDVRKDILININKNMSYVEVMQQISLSCSIKKPFLLYQYECEKKILNDITFLSLLK